MRIIVLLIFFFSSTFLYSQQDEIIYKHRKFKVVFNVKKGNYTVYNPKRSETINNLRFVKQINEYFQILDSNYNLYFYSEKEGRKDTVIDYYCFSAPEQKYELHIETVDDEYHIIEENVFYEYSSSDKKLINWFPVALADSLVFINGKSNFVFSEGYLYNTFSKVDPRTLIICKDDQYIFPDGSVYEWVSVFSGRLNYSNILVGKNDLFGYYCMFEPRYVWLSDFNYYLAKYKKKNGDEGYVDMEGNEY